MAFYVSLDGVDEDTLSIVGFVLIDENEATKLYRYCGEDILVDKSDPFVYVDDLNDAAILGSEIIPMPPKNHGH